MTAVFLWLCAKAIGCWYDVALYPYGPDYALCLHEDITECKRSEEAPRASEERLRRVRPM